MARRAKAKQATVENVLPFTGKPDTGRLTARPRPQKLSPIPFQSFTDWDNPAVVMSALREHQQGRFSRSAQIVDAMFQDDRLAGVGGTRIKALTGCEFDFTPDGEAATRLAGWTGVNGLWKRMVPRSALYDLLRWGFFLGFGLGENVWATEEVEEGWVPAMRIWHPRFVRFDITLRKYFLNAMEGEFEITPGDGQWVLFTPYGYDGGFMHALVRSLHIAWQSRQWALRDWARWGEAHGMPLLKVNTPPAAKEEEVDAIVMQLAQRASDATVVLPKWADGTGYDASYLEASAGGWEGFQGNIQGRNTDMAVGVLGQELTTEVGNKGSYAAALVQDNVRSDILADDALALEDCINEQVLQPWHVYNYGGKREDAPLLKYRTKPPDNAKDTGDAMTSLGTGIAGLKEAGVQLDVDKVTEQLRIPTTGNYEEPEPPEPPVIVPGGIPPAPGAKGTFPQPGKTPAGKPVAASGPASKHQRMLAAVVGQQRVDTATRKAMASAVQALTPARIKLLQCVALATSPADLKHRIVAAFEGLDETHLADVLTVGMVEAELAGFWSGR